LLRLARNRRDWMFTLMHAFFVGNTEYRWLGGSRMIGAGRQKAANATRSLWRIAVLTVAGALCAAAEAEAALFYWPDSDPGYYYRPALTYQQRRQKFRHHQAKKIAVPNELAKPQGPLIIAISIEKQSLKIYDANGLFAETPISTGMKGHPTPMGVFSVIQKHKLHHSNIYSGAPMPFMQRITWSGVAIHAGVLPGYPASHGCIRMPMAFAIKMWNWTKMGVRVVITPGETTPANFSHPLLATQKVAPQPAAANEAQMESPPAGNADKAATADPAVRPAISASFLELRSTVGHNNAQPEIEQARASAALRERNETADAGNAMSAAKTPATMTDANSFGGNASQRGEKDQTQVPDTDKPAAPKPDPAPATPPKLAGQIAVFVSRKDSKLYVRQNFAPLFEAPVKIASSDRPLGTHVFTVRVEKDPGNTLHWSVVSLPGPARYAERRDVDERASRRRKIAGAVEITLPDSPTEALDRLTIPADATARITEALSTGSSIIVSDQGIAAGETGEGTDFIVSLR
jgi:lipoprotein-anchoring transpeptidase ErfK/SrfK